MLDLLPLDILTSILLLFKVCELWRFSRICKKIERLCKKFMFKRYELVVHITKSKEFDNLEHMKEVISYGISNYGGGATTTLKLNLLNVFEDETMIHFKPIAPIKLFFGIFGVSSIMKLMMDEKVITLKLFGLNFEVMTLHHDKKVQKKNLSYELSIEKIFGSSMVNGSNILHVGYNVTISNLCFTLDKQFIIQSILGDHLYRFGERTEVLCKCVLERSKYEITRRIVDYYPRLRKKIGIIDSDPLIIEWTFNGRKKTIESLLSDIRIKMEWENGMGKIEYMHTHSFTTSERMVSVNSTNDMWIIMKNRVQVKKQNHSINDQ